ncbi:MAG: phage late control D family protein [Bradymonadia bacterium]
METSNRVPDYKIKVNGSELPQEDRVNVQEIFVDLRRQAPASVEIQLNNHEGTYDEREDLAPGAQISVELGYQDDSTTQVFEGEIIGTQVKAKQNGPRVFLIRAFDYSHRLTRGRKQRNFNSQKFSDLVTTLAQEVGLTPDVEDTQFNREYVAQHNQTNLDFVRGMAGWLDFDLCIRHLEDPKKLRFKPPELSAAEAVTVVYENPNLQNNELHLKKFDGRQSLARVVSHVTVRGWNPGGKAAYIGRAGPDKLYDEMSGDSSAVQMVLDKWGETERQIVDCKVFSQEEADKIAECKLNEYARTFIRVDMEVQGSTLPYPGCTVKAERVGPRYDGKYFVDSVHHIFTSKVGASHGYTTRFIASRCAW